jgi:sarcosine oxidase subunit delta
MRIECPHCGLRPSEEFTFLGDAVPRRPEPSAGMEEWYDYVYLRRNPKGRFHEYVHHSGGCRVWLVVERHTETHEIFSVTTAREWARNRRPANSGERGKPKGSRGAKK